MRTYKKNRPCPKCGSTSINDEYKDVQETMKILNSSYDVPEANHPKTYDLIQRTCNNCNYFWNEKVLDNKEY